MTVSAGVWKCVQAHVQLAVFMCACVVQCRTKADTSTEVGVESRKEREAFIFAHACRDPNGDHMPESGQESFCVINTRSLGVPCCQGLRYRFRAPNRGSRQANEIILRHR